MTENESPQVPTESISILPTSVGTTSPMPLPPIEEINQSFDIHKFIEDNRIHVEFGSLILPSEILLPIHPRELAPEKEEVLRTKIRRAYSTEILPFFHDENALKTVAGLSQLMPLSFETKEAAASDKLRILFEEIRKGKDPDLSKEQEKEDAPFSSLIDQKLSYQDRDPIQIEQAQNGLGLLLVLEKALQNKNFVSKGGVLPFIKGAKSGEEMVAKLSHYLGVDTKQLLKTISEDGYEGAAELLGIDEHYVQEVGQLNKYLVEHKFSENAVKNWQIGRFLPGMERAGIQEKINAGIEQRINAKIIQSRMAVGYQYDVPEAIQKDELRVAGMLRALPPVMLKVLHQLKVDFTYTRKPILGHVFPGAPLLGAHLPAHENPDDTMGFLQIHLSGDLKPEQMVRVAVHEVNHLLMPNYFTKSEMQQVDSLAKEDVERLKALNELADSWMQGNDTVRAQIVDTLNRPEFSVNGQNFTQMLGDADMQTFFTQAKSAYQNLNPTSEMFHQSGYGTPEARFAEVNSRFAEMYYVRLRENPELLRFLVPGITKAHEKVYLPHIVELSKDLEARETFESHYQANSRQAIASIEAMVAPHAHQAPMLLTPPPHAAQTEIHSASAALQKPIEIDASQDKQV